MPGSANAASRPRGGASTGPSSASTGSSSKCSSRPKTVSESTPSRRVASSYLRQVEFLGRQEPKIVYSQDASRSIVAWADKSGLSGGGPIKPPHRGPRKTPSSHSNISAPPIVQNGSSWQRDGAGGRGHRVTKSDHTTRRKNAKEQTDDVNRLANSAPAGTKISPSSKPTHKPPLPKLNNLVTAETYGVTSATQASRDHSNRHWASSWADAYSRNSAAIPREAKPSPHRTAQTTTASSTTETEQRTPRTTHDAHRDIIKKPKRPIIITKRTIAQTKTLKAVYSNTSFTKQRQTRILKQLEDIELKDAEEYNQKIVEKEKVVRDKRAKQRQALKRLRNKFDEEQVQRFKTQYVTWKSVEHERRGRRSEMYGLPETLDDEELTKLIVKKKKESTGKKFKQPGTREQILRKYVHVVNPKVGSEHDIDQFKTSNNNVILEGINTVELANKDNPSGKKTNVRTVIGSAKRMLSVHSDMDAISEVSSIRDEDTANEDSDYIFSDSGP